jgi:hypothetical protein
MGVSSLVNIRSTDLNAFRMTSIPGRRRIRVAAGRRVQQGWGETLGQTNVGKGISGGASDRLLYPLKLAAYAGVYVRGGIRRGPS